MMLLGQCTTIEVLLHLHPLEGFCQNIEFQQKSTSDTSFASYMSVFFTGNVAVCGSRSQIHTAGYHGKSS